MVALAAAIGGVAGAAIEGDARSVLLRDLIGEPEHLVFVLADGLGVDLLEHCAEGAYLRAQMARELRTVYPSSTAPALTTLVTGAWPAAHGATGWWTYIPSIERTITLLPYVDRFTQKPAGDLGLRVTDVFPIAATMATSTRDVSAVMPKWIADSAYTRYVAAGRGVIPYTALANGIDDVIARVRSANRPTYTYVYTPLVDTVEHHHGPHSRETRTALAEVDREIARLAEAIGGRARIVLTADHGQMEARPRDKVVLARDDELVRLLALPPSCEPRSPAFHCKPGCQGEFAAMFRDRFGERFALLSLDEAERLRLFGPDPLPAETRGRLGDFVGIALDDSVVLYDPPPDLVAMKGFHGGMSQEEMRIPLVLI
jgi:hypothetical protein